MQYTKISVILQVLNRNKVSDSFRFYLINAVKYTRNCSCLPLCVFFCLAYCFCNYSSFTDMAQTTAVMLHTTLLTTKYGCFNCKLMKFKSFAFSIFFCKKKRKRCVCFAMSHLILVVGRTDRP